MKLSLIHEDTQRQELYKGVSESSQMWHLPPSRVNTGLKNLSGSVVPGFLGTYNIAHIYAEPKLTGSADQKSVIISVIINKDEVEDLTQEFRQWFEKKHAGKRYYQSYDVSGGTPIEWSNRIWTTTDGFGDPPKGTIFGFTDFVYCGKPKPFKIIKSYNNQQEWLQDWEKNRGTLP